MVPRPLRHIKRASTGFGTRHANMVSCTRLLWSREYNIETIEAHAANGSGGTAMKGSVVLKDVPRRLPGNEGLVAWHCVGAAHF
jgi:hypothetical protein